MTTRAEEELQQMFIALTARWRKENGQLAIGTQKSKLLKAGGWNEEETERSFARLRSALEPIGLEVVEYICDGELWCAVRSSYVCPSELKTEEEALLAAIISFVEASKAKSAPIESLEKKLVGSKYFSRHQMDRLLKNLEDMGYVRKKNREVVYSPRTLLEFSEESRKHIAEEARRFVI